MSRKRISAVSGESFAFVLFVLVLFPGCRPPATKVPVASKSSTPAEPADTRNPELDVAQQPISEIENQPAEYFDNAESMAKVHIVLLDDSSSMSESSDGKTAYSKAIDALEVLMEAASHQRRPQNFVVWQASELNDSMVSRNVVVSIQQATEYKSVVEKLREKGPVSREFSPESYLPLIQHKGDSLFIYSDFRANEWEYLLKDFSIGSKFAFCRLIQCAQQSNGNMAVSDLKLRLSPDKTFVTVDVEVWNRSTIEASEKAASVFVDGIESEPIIFGSVAAGERLRMSADILLHRAGSHWVSVQLPDDSFAPDNSRHAAINTSPSTVIVFQDAEDVKPNSLEVALRIGFPDSSIQVLDIASISGEILQAVDIICLDRIREITGSASTAIDEYVRNGGNIFYVAGADASVSSLNSLAYDDGKGWFPCEISQITKVKEIAERDTQLHFQTYEKPGKRSGESKAEFQALDLRTVEDLLGSVVVETFMQAEGDPSEAGYNIHAATNSNGNIVPWLVSHRHGKGQVLALLASLELDWVSQSNETAKYILTNKAIAFLGAPQSSIVSSPLRVRIADGADSVKISKLNLLQDPHLIESAVLLRDSSDQRYVEFLNTSQPGIYVSTNPGEEADSQYFAVNSIIDETDQRILYADELNAILRNRFENYVAFDVDSWRKLAELNDDKNEGDDPKLATFARVLNVDRASEKIDLAIVHLTTKSIEVPTDTNSPTGFANADLIVQSITERKTTISMRDTRLTQVLSSSGSMKVSEITGDDIWKQLTPGRALILLDSNNIQVVVDMQRDALILVPTP